MVMTHYDSISIHDYVHYMKTISVIGEKSHIISAPKPQNLSRVVEIVMSALTSIINHQYNQQ